MRLTRLATALVSILVVAACTSSAAGWTYAPVPPATPVPSSEPGASGGTSAAPSGGASGGTSAAPSGGASGGASAAPSAEGSAPASAGASAGASGATGGSVVQLSATGVAFDQTDLTAPAGAPFQIQFQNNDASIPHDVAIKDASGAEVFKGDVFPGVAAKTYDVPALAAGSYTFMCTVHPNMTGTLTAG